MLHRSPLVLALAAATLALAACKDEPQTSAPAATPSGAPTAAAAAADVLKPGDRAPDITLKLQDGKEVKLSSLAGTQVLVYFYPKDDTPGCTIEAQGLRDGWADISAAGVAVYGVSMQDAESHKAFIEKYKLPFPLVVDGDGAVARAFHVPVRGAFASRQSFLVGKDGKIKQVWLDVDPRAHAAAILAAARS